METPITTIPVDLLGNPITNYKFCYVSVGGELRKGKIMGSGYRRSSIGKIRVRTYSMGGSYLGLGSTMKTPRNGVCNQILMYTGDETKFFSPEETVLIIKRAGI